MFRIGEFSKLTQVSIRMLRYYDEMNLLKPATTDRFTGYRLYSTDQIPVLNKIIFLRDVGFQVAEISKALNNWETNYIIRELEQKQKDIDAVIEEYRTKRNRIDAAKQDITAQTADLHYNISIKPVPGCLVLSLRKIIPDYYAEGALWKELSAFAQKYAVTVSSETFSIYHDSDYREKIVDVELCVPVNKQGKDMDEFRYRTTQEVPTMAYTMVYGSFTNIAGAYRSFASWLQEHEEYKMLETSRQIVHRGPWNEEDPEHFLTELQIPVEKISTS